MRFLLFIIWFSLPASAEVKTISFTNSDGDDAHVLLYDREGCESTLRGLLLPNSLAAGLSAISKLNTNETSVSSACLDELLKSWDPAQMMAEIPSPIESDREYDSSNYYRLQEQLVCFNPNEKGTKKFKEYAEENPECKNWLTKAQHDKLQEKLVDETAKYKQARDEKELSNRIMAALKEFAPTYDSTYDLTKLKELRSKLECRNPYPSGSYYFTSYEKEHPACNDKWLSKEDADELKVQQAAEQKKYNEHQKGYNQYTELKEDFLSSTKNLALLGQPGLLEKSKQLMCYGQNLNFSSEYQKAKIQKLCEGLPPSPELVAPLKKEIQAAFQAFPGALAKFKEAREKLRQAKLEWNQKTQEQKNLNYSVRRLLYHYRKAAAGGVSQIGKFCAAYEGEQKAEFDYAKANPELLHFFTSEDEWKLAARYNLSESQYGAIREYTNSYYQRINTPLNEGQALSPELKAYKQRLEEGLRRLPAYKGEVRREAQLPDEVAKKHQLGSTVCYSAFTSTSKKKDWSWSGNHHFLINTVSGRYVKELSGNPSEEEVLIPAGACFKVIGRKQSKDGYGTNFVLQEISKK